MGVGGDPVDVSVVIPARDCRPYLDRCLTAALVQRVVKEIVVVDDGSTDGTAELLGLYAAHHRGTVKVIRVEGSGGAGRPRNIGLAHATGRYVFFCDADDYLGPEALEHLLAAADRNDADIVLGKIVGHGRRVPESMFHRNAERAELGESAVYNSLSCFKLFRRELLERHRIRFREGVLIGEDIYFTVHAYCHARTISVVADRDCYHLVARPDGSSVMQRPDSRDPLAWLSMIREPIGLMTGHVPPGPLRDHLLARHFKLDILAQLGAPFLRSGEVRRKEVAAAVAALCDRWLTPGVRDRLADVDRRRLDALDDVDLLARLAVIEAAPVTRRLTGLCWDGRTLVVAGEAALTGCDEPDRVSVVLRTRHEPRRELIVPAGRSGGRFVARIDPALLTSGVWDLRVSVEVAGVARSARLGADRDTALARPPARLVGEVAVLPYFTRDNGNLSLDVGGHAIGVPGSARLVGARWSVGRRLVLDGEVAVAGVAPPPAAVRRLVWRERGSGSEQAERVVARAGGGFVASPAVGRFGPGVWDAYLELDLGGPPARFRIEAGDDPVAGSRRWLLGAGPCVARPYATSHRGRLSAVVRRLSARAFLRKIIR
ncbi:glycosyltransferase family 2 protein [Nonomuraea sp. CA-218870]|uniref:glycosyltransferase family 2 protein n=1 Tax=Nonomuraea sp. CA-218870 TaxID=3239998 RepID=UPI003D93B091